jgi:hypothetical protein
MRLDAKAFAIAFSLIWAGMILLVGIAHLVWPAYGGDLLAIAASIYPGYHVGGLGSVIVGTLYALVDGAVGGFVFAWLYNAAAGRGAARS